jgi:ribosome-associated toxin RatA of RatAB toxin-antitoxin module
MFEIISNIDNYHKFVPYVIKSTHFNPTKTGSSNANLVVGYNTFSETYLSTLKMKSPEYVKSQVSRSKIFSSLENVWMIAKYGNANNQCIIDFTVEFKFNSIIYNQLSNMVLDPVANSMVRAFEKRAFDLYGPASRDSIRI